MVSHIGKTCPYCKMEIKFGDSVTVCPECGVAHHTACWEKNGGCTTLGCKQGSKKAAKYCGSCGAPMEEGQVFCGRCGKSAHIKKRRSSQLLQTIYSQSTADIVFLIIISSLILRLSGNFLKKPIGDKREKRYHTSEYQHRRNKKKYQIKDVCIRPLGYAVCDFHNGRCCRKCL